MRRSSIANAVAPKATSSSGPDSSTRQNVRVICRVRPVNKKELSSGGITCVKVKRYIK